MRTIAVSACALATLLAFAAPASAKPRFSVREVVAQPTAVAAGQSVSAVATVREVGKVKKPTRLHLRLRTPQAVVSLERRRTPRFVGREDFTLRGSVPGGLQSGPHQLEVCVPKYGKRGPRRCDAASVVITAPEPTTTTDPPGTDPPSTTAPNFQPGARSLNDPLLPQIGNGGYDAEHYDIDLDYDPVANNFDRAVLTMRAAATQDLSELSLDFQDLAVDRVLVNGAAAEFSQIDAVPVLAGGGTQPMKLVVDPAAGIANNSTFTVRVEYRGTPQVFTDPDGSDEGWIPSPSCPAPGCSYFVVGEPMGSQAWFPSNNHPSDKASFDTAITVPSSNTALGVGELAGRVANGDGTTTWSWREGSPTATYLVTASTAATPLPDQYAESTITEALTGRTLPIYDTIATSALPASAQISTMTARNAEMLNALGAHYGPYPLDSYGSVWDNNPGVGYALEVQTKSHFSVAPTSASTYLHELAHQWWGNAVTLHDWNDLWFNEGWAQFSDWLFAFESGANANSPKDRFDDEYAGASASDWSIAPAVLDNDPAKMFSPSFPTYTRGAMTLAGFREIIGHADFDGFARALQVEFSYGNIDTPEFIAFAKQRSGFSGLELARLDAYFQQWLYGTTKPTITPDNF